MLPIQRNLFNPNVFKSMQQGTPVFLKPFTQTYTYVGEKKASERKILQRSTTFHSLQLWLNPYSSHSFARARVSPGDSTVERCMRTYRNSLALPTSRNLWVQEFFLTMFLCILSWELLSLFPIHQKMYLYCYRTVTPNLFGTNLRIGVLPTSTFSRQLKFKEVCTKICYVSYFR